MKLTRTGEVRAIAAALSAGRVEGTCGCGAGACAAAGVVERAVERAVNRAVAGGVIKGSVDRAERESAAACAVGAEAAEALGFERGSLLAKRIGLAVFRAAAAEPEADGDGAEPERFDEMTGPWGRGG